MSSHFSPRTLIHFGRGFLGIVLLGTPFLAWISSAEGGSSSLINIIYHCWLMTAGGFSATELIHNSVITVCLLIILLGSFTLVIPSATRIMRVIALGLGLLFVGSVLYFGAAVASWGIWLYGAAVVVGLTLEAAESLLEEPAPQNERIPFEPMHYMI